MPIPFDYPGDDKFLVSIAHDARLGEYRASFVNQNYGVRLAAPTISRLKHRTMRLLRRYIGVADEDVMFRNAAARPGDMADAA